MLSPSNGPDNQDDPVLCREAGFKQSTDAVSWEEANFSLALRTSVCRADSDLPVQTFTLRGGL